MSIDCFASNVHHEMKSSIQVGGQLSPPYFISKLPIGRNVAFIMRVRDKVFDCVVIYLLVCYYL